MAAFLNDAETVEVFRLEPLKPPSTGARVIGGYEIVSQVKNQGPAFAKEIAVLLNEPRTVSPKGCIFAPGVAFRAIKGGKAVEVLICFQCDVLVLARWDGPGHMADLDRVRASWVRLAKRAFPQDEKIQAISELNSSADDL